MRFLIPVTVAALALAGCAGTGTALLRQAAIDTVQSYNNAGFDPLQLSPTQIALLAASCGTATTVITVWNPAVPSAPEGVRDLCAVILAAAAPASVPVPEPRPEG